MSETNYENKLRPGYYENNYANMAATFIVETERWNLASTLFPAPTAAGQVPAASPTPSAHGGHGGVQPVSSDGPATVRASNRSQRLPVFVRGLATALSGSGAAEENVTKPGTISRDMESKTIGELEIAAVASSVKRDHEQAAELMKQAIRLEEEMGPPSGPPGLIKPAHELFGEILLRAGKPEAAAEQFKVSLLRQPNRARSLLGAARAAAQGGDPREASAAYTKLLEQWRQADEGLPELREARDYLKKVKL